MKKFVAACVVMLVVGAVSPTFALNVGYWDLTTELKNGVWSEAFDGGGPGQAGNFFGAGDSNAWYDGGPIWWVNGTQWMLGGCTLTSVEQDNSGIWDYITQYQGGWMWLPDFGGTLAYMYNATAINKSKLIYANDGSVLGLDFAIEITGVYEGYDILMTATFSGTFADESYWFWYDAQQNIIGHGGKDFTTLSLKISNPVPEPSTVLLLGVGLMGLIGLRKKLVK